MSIKRIESAYAYYCDKKMSVTQMAVLQALAYSENEKTGKCYPSYAALAKLGHVNVDTVRVTCRALKEMGAISWVKGGQHEGVNVSNVYRFLFPQTKMASKKERYEAILEERVGGLAGDGILSGREGYPVYKGTGTLSGREGVPCQPVVTWKGTRNISRKQTRNRTRKETPPLLSSLNLRDVPHGRSRKPIPLTMTVPRPCKRRWHSAACMTLKTTGLSASGWRGSA